MSARRLDLVGRLSAWMGELQARLRANAEATWSDDAPASALGPAATYRSMRAAFGPRRPCNPAS